MSAKHDPESFHSQAGFATTQWSMVLAAREKGGAGSREALARLCASYWYPLYAFLRRKGHSVHDAQDLTQGFFARLLDKQDLAGVHERHGRFRSFLLAAIQNFASNQRDYDRAQKRGGGVQMLSLDFAAAEGRYSAEPIDSATPDRLFEHKWATELLARVLEQLRDELSEAGRGDWFTTVKPLLAAERDAPSYADAAQSLGTTEGALKVAVHRLRRRYRELLRQEVAQTVDDPAEIDAELRHLARSLREK